MNSEWIYLEIARLILSLVLVYIAYLFGLRSQKIQALREYITETVKDKYPQLFAEIKRNSERLDSYLKNPFVNFGFPQLEQIYDEGRDEFMKKQHKDLHRVVDSLHKQIRPKLYEFYNLSRDSRKKISLVWEDNLINSLPIEAQSKSRRIAEDLIKNINQYNVLSLLLNKRHDEVRKKIRECISPRTSLSPSLTDEIPRLLIEKAKPEIANLIEEYKELKKQNDTEVKKKLLPLLQKYISNPI